MYTYQLGLWLCASLIDMYLKWFLGYSHMGWNDDDEYKKCVTEKHWGMFQWYQLETNGCISGEIGGLIATLLLQPFCIPYLFLENLYYGFPWCFHVLVCMQNHVLKQNVFYLLFSGFCFIGFRCFHLLYYGYGWKIPLKIWIL